MAGRRPAEVLVWYASHGRFNSDPTPNDTNPRAKLHLTCLQEIGQNDATSAIIVGSTFQTETGVLIGWLK